MDIKSLIKQHYNIEVNQVIHLEGLEDKTFKIVSPESIYVFKQYQHTRGTLNLIQAENLVLEKLAEEDEFHFPKNIPTSLGEPIIIDEKYICRLLTFVDGELLGNSIQGPDICYSFGRLLGKMDRHLGAVHEPVLGSRHYEWDLRFLLKNLPLLEYIENVTDRNLVRYFFLQYKEHVSPRAHELRFGTIHNDANDWNVTVKNDRISGIFDFGDLVYSWLINELAVGITYIMMDKEDPLSSACSAIKGYHAEIPLTEEEIDLLYYLVGARLCLSLCNSAYGKKTKPDSDYVTISERPAWDLLRKWIAINPVNAKNQFRSAAGFDRVAVAEADVLLEQRSKHISPILSLSYKQPIAMSGASFQYMYDNSGNTFLDAYNNIMLAGHCHPHVVESGQRAMAELNTNTRYLYDSLNTYAERLLNKFPAKLNKVFFVNSGSEASDLAIRMARVYDRRNTIAVLENGYHGHTSTATSISHYKYAAKGGIGKNEHILQLPMPKYFGSGYENETEAGNYFYENSLGIIELYTKQVAAFIAEPIMGCGGQVPLAKGYLNQLYKTIRDQGGLCISDEVQVGFGRLGSSFWGYELHDVVPDIVVLGKPMGNGHPIGAVVTTAEVAERFEQGPEFFSSFGGNPVSCAIGMAVLDVIEAEGLQEKAFKTGSHLISLLEELRLKYPILADIRGQGMFLGIELADENNAPLTELAGLVKNKLRENYVLVGTDGPEDNVLKVKPPLSFNIANAETLYSKLDNILGSIL